MKNKKEKMEVHTHGHIHETKKWKEYVFQFIMLFLAVTLGFFVENQREHYIEHQRAKILAASIVQNLEEDLKEVDGIVMVSDSIIMNNNLLIGELNKPREQQNDSLIHRNGLQKISRFNVFDPNAGNYEQVKYSGALRYFTPEIVNKLTAYETNRNYVLKIARNYLEFNTQTLIPFCLKNCNPRFADAIIKETAIPNPVFSQSPTPELLDQIYNYAIYITRQNQQQINIVKVHGEYAKELVKLLNETYELK